MTPLLTRLDILLPRLTLMIIFAAFGLAADLNAVKAEPNPEKRAYLALDNAHQAVDRARQSYAKGKYEEAQSALAEVRESVDLCHDSLRDAGKEPSKDKKQFKRVELRTSALLRRLRDFRIEASVQDHPAIDRVITHLEKINDEILEGLFSKRSK